MGTGTSQTTIQYEYYYDPFSNNYIPIMMQCESGKSPNQPSSGGSFNNFDSKLSASSDDVTEA